jgi:hypothetical protein
MYRVSDIVDRASYFFEPPRFKTSNETLAMKKKLKSLTDHDLASVSEMFLKHLQLIQGPWTALSVQGAIDSTVSESHAFQVNQRVIKMALRYCLTGWPASSGDLL